MARNPLKGTRLAGGLILAVLVGALGLRNASAQIIVGPGGRIQVGAGGRIQVGPAGRPAKAKSPDSDEDNPFSTVFPSDRETAKRLSDARNLLAKERFGEAVRNLGKILDAPEDYFVQPDKNSSARRSLKSEAQRLIGEMPAGGRELYELQYGARARNLLDEALASGDPTKLAEVARRFFHSRAGYQATFLLGMRDFELGRPAAALPALRRLRDVGPSADAFEPNLSLTIAACQLRLGMVDKAAETLVALRGRQPNLRVTIGGRETPIFTDNAKAVDWLVGLVGKQTTAGPDVPSDWLMFRGDAARNAATEGSSPLLNLRWRVELTDDPESQAAMERFERDCDEEGRPLIPSLHPLAVGDVLLMRSLHTLVAVDFVTGKRLWETRHDEPSEAAVNPYGQDQQTQKAMLAAGLRQRMAGDMTYGVLASDGRCVFVIEDLSLDFGSGTSLNGRRVILGPRVIGIRNGLGATSGRTALSNRLAAYDIHTGKLKWRIGGSADDHAARQPDTFFLGAPLPLMGQLYALAEIGGEIRLLVLNPATGDLVWSQQLGSAEQDISEDGSRRWSGVSPAYADGVLVCPTAAGAIVGVDPVSRTLLWGFLHEMNAAEDRRNIRRFRFNQRTAGTTNDASASRWVDGSVTIGGDRVLVTPADSELLYCLDLHTGALQWKRPRGKDIYVACIDDDRIVLVASNGLHAIRLADGSPAWGGRTLTLPEGEMPSGRGFATADSYILPLNNGETISVSLFRGDLLHTSQSLQGGVSGNLICHRGMVVSQGLEGVDVYAQLDVARQEAERRLAVDPSDADALTLKGEVLLESGKREEAVATFESAYAIDPNQRTRELLRNTIFDGLVKLFADYRGRAAEIERLLDTPAQHATFLRLMAGGLRQAGEPAAAFDYYRKVIDLEPGKRPLDLLDKTWFARRDRWVCGQLTELRAESKGEAAAEIDRAVEASVEAALAAGGSESLRRWLANFDGFAAAAAARDELVRRLGSEGRPLDAELAVTTSPAAHAAAPSPTAWPIGKVEVDAPVAAAKSGQQSNRWDIEIQGNRGPYFRDVSLEFDTNSAHPALIARDGLGHELWQVSLLQPGQSRSVGINTAWTHARVDGHLLIVSLGTRILAIDTLGLPPKGSPRVLWNKDLTDPNLESEERFGLPFQVMRWRAQGGYGRPNDPSNALNAVGRNHLCFQRSRELTALEPATGETAWQRRDLPSGCELFGDDQYIFALPPDREEAIVLRAIDGRRLGTRKIPRQTVRQILADGEEKQGLGRLEDNCLTTLGRKLLLWWPDGGHRTLTLTDPWEGRDVWEGRQFTGDARACVIGDEAVAVMERSGRFVLVSLPDGRTIADVQLAPEPNLGEITAFENGGQYFLLAESTAGRSSSSNIQPISGQMFRPIYHGKLYAFSRDGKPLWPSPAIIKNLQMLAKQPSQLPVLTFAAQSYHQGNAQARITTKIVCIDRRNGRTAYKGQFDNMVGFCRVSGDPKQKMVEISVPQKTIKLAFTDKPYPPSAAKPAKPPENAAARELWKSIKKVFGTEDEDAEDE